MLSELGRRVQINFTVTNGGPSSIGQGRLTIRIPTRNPCTKNAYLFYLVSVTVSMYVLHIFGCLSEVKCWVGTSPKDDLGSSGIISVIWCFYLSIVCVHAPFAITICICTFVHVTLTYVSHN